MGTNKRILISGYYGFDNSGDDAILKAMVKDIKAKDSNIKITAFSNNPNFTKKTYDIDAVNRFGAKGVAKAIRDCDLFISGGGSLLQDITSTRSLLYYISLMKLAKLFNKPVMVYANGIGPINKRINRFLTRKILDKVDLITLRDENSRIFLRELEVQNDNIYVTADPVFTLEPTREETILEIFEKEEIPDDRPLVGISVRDWTNVESLIDVISHAINYIIDRYHANVVLIPMHYPEDLDISNSILKNIAREGAYILKNKYSVEEIMGITKRLEMIIAMRLHSLIYAATQGIPMVGIVYDPKIEGFLKSIDMEHMCSAENIEYKHLIKNIDYVWSNRDNLKVRLVELDQQMRDEALKNTDMALKLLEK